MKPVCGIAVSDSVFQLYVTGVSVRSLLVVSGVRFVMFFLRVRSEEHESAVVVGLMSQVPVLFWNRATIPETPLLPTWRVYAGDTTPIPMRPPEIGVMLGLPPVTLYVPVPKRTPPMLILFAAASGSEMLVPMMMLFEPRLLPVKVRPALYPKRFEYEALVAPEPACKPKKFEL